ncbi:MAG: hypothetical protein WC788_04395 [Candidatus Paceibacterota bacterium]|jgi:hypothetical protein
MKRFIKENWFRTTIIIVLSVIAFIFVLSNRYYFIQRDAMIVKCDKFTGSCEEKSLSKMKTVIQKPPVLCNFEIRNITKDGNYYIGSIKNNSADKHFLKAVIAKVYNDEDVLVAGGYDSIEDWIEPSKSLPFRIHTFLGDDTNLKRDIYPWFTTCK